MATHEELREALHDLIDATQLQKQSCTTGGTYDPENGQFGQYTAVETDGRCVDRRDVLDHALQKATRLVGTRRPRTLSLGDGVYCLGHNKRLVIWTHDGVSKRNQIYLEPGSLRSLQAAIMDTLTEGETK